MNTTLMSSTGSTQKNGARRAAPPEVAVRADHLVGCGIVGDREAEPEADAVEGGLGEQRAAELPRGRRHPAGGCGPCRRGCGARGCGCRRRCALLQEVAELEVVGHRRHQPTAAGQERRRLGGDGAEAVEPQRQSRRRGWRRRGRRAGRACRPARAKPVSVMPSGSKIRSRRKSSRRWPRHDLDDAAEHVGGDAVVPLGAGLEQERQRGPRVAAAAGVEPGGRARLEAGGPVHGVDGVAVVEAVGEARRCG